MANPSWKQKALYKHGGLYFRNDLDHSKELLSLHNYYQILSEKTEIKENTQVDMEFQLAK